MAILVAINLAQIIVILLLVAGGKMLYNQYKAYQRSEAGICLAALDRANWTHIKFSSRHQAYSWCEENKKTWRDQVNYIILREAEDIEREIAQEEEREND